MPAQPLPGAQASASLLAFTFVSKYHDALPLYRQQQIWGPLRDRSASGEARALVDRRSGGPAGRCTT